MATKSFIKDVEIKNKKLGNDFVNALEVAMVKSESSSENNDVMMSKCKELKEEEINDFFGVYK